MLKRSKGEIKKWHKVEEDKSLAVLKEDIKNSLSVSEVFERYYGPLRKIQVDAYTALCPFHSDTQ